MCPHFKINNTTEINKTYTFVKKTLPVFQGLTLVICVVVVVLVVSDVIVCALINTPGSESALQST